MESNRYSAKARLCPGHIAWVHNHARFEDNLLPKSDVISK